MEFGNIEPIRLENIVDACLAGTKLVERRGQL